MLSAAPVITVNLNPCLDWQYNVPHLLYGGLNRVHHADSSPAGKGINVAVVLKNLQQDVMCQGFNFTDGAAPIEEKLNAHHIPHDFVMVPGQVRVNIKLYEEENQTMTELNQPGAFVAKTYVEQLIARLQSISYKYAGQSILVLSGSVPTGVGADIYSTLTSIWQGPVFVDCAGPLLKAVLNGGAQPYAIKPNIHELESTFGLAENTLKTPTDVAQFCQRHLFGEGSGLQFACVSMGGQGAVLVTKSQGYFAKALDLPVRGLQGAGDSMVAGLVRGISKGLPLGEVLRYGMAAAAGSVVKLGTHLCTQADFDQMLALIPPPQMV